MDKLLKRGKKKKGGRLSNWPKSEGGERDKQRAKTEVQSNLLMPKMGCREGRTPKKKGRLM